MALLNKIIFHWLNGIQARIACLKVASLRLTPKLTPGPNRFVLWGESPPHSITELPITIFSILTPEAHATTPRRSFNAQGFNFWLNRST